jgi:serine/threonine protein kinase
VLINRSDTTGDPHHSDELPPGTVLFHGQYSITRHIGGGGFGITYLAKNSLKRDVILKECFVAAHCRRNNTKVSARTRDSSQSIKKFLRYFIMEARTLSSLNHPNIVKVHETFEDNDTAYMALDYLQGRDLLQVIESADATLGPTEIAEITRKMVSAVEYIHQSGLVHGDISPDNIFLNDEGEPILIDFGAARHGGRDVSQTKHTGFIIVKDGYSPHESYIANGHYGPWSDIYALAASVYHAITGTVPIGSQIRLLALAESNADPCEPLDGRFAGYPPGFLQSLDKAMSALPAARFQSAQKWLDVLNVSLSHEDHKMKLLGKTIRIGGLNRPDKDKPAAVRAAVSDVPEPTKAETLKPQAAKHPLKGKKMAIDLSGLKDIGGFISGCLVDTESGLMMASETVGTFDIETAAAANVEVVRAKNNAMSLLGLNDSIEDILITLTTQLHLIRPLEKMPSMFVYVALDRKTANLGLARAQVKKVEQGIKM